MVVQWDSSSGLQSSETARCEFVLDGMIAALWNGSLHESVLVNEKQRGTSPESPVSFTMIIEKVQFGSHENCVEAERHCIDCDLLCGRCGVGCCVSCCCGSGGDKGYCKVGRGKVCLTVGAQKTLWTSHLKMVEKHHSGWTGCVEGGRPGVCGIEGVSRWECKTCDRDHQFKPTSVWRSGDLF